MSEAVNTTAVAIREDNGKPALYNPAAFDQIWRASKLFASSDLVPTAYKGKPENCFIAIEMADRMGISPFAMLQSLVIIQGKPSMEAKLIIALVNDSGIFENPLEYEVEGDDPHAQNYRVRCFATMKKTGKLCQGPWITYQMVKGEGWLDKGGSKWKTMPGIMFAYRAASFFAKLYAPNITMGMQTREEMEDVKAIDITPERQAPPMLVGAGPIAVQPIPKSETPPPLAAPTAPEVIAEAEVVDVETGEITPVETEEQKKTRTRRTKEQIAADKAAVASAPVEAAPPVDLDADWPVSDGPTQQTPAPAEEPPPPDDEPETCGDLF